MPMINIEDAYILGETGAQVDKVTGLYFKNENASDTEKAQARANIGAGGSNRNLLDNPWWGTNESINQRGVTSGNGGYFADRWNFSLPGTASVTWTTDENGFTGTTTTNFIITQKIHNVTELSGKTLTASVMLSDGTIHSGTIVRNNATAQEFFRNSNPTWVVLMDSDNSFRIRVFNGTLSIRAVKLELGSVSTLANDAPPEYETELLKCQYYAAPLEYTTYSNPFTGLAASATEFFVEAYLPRSMREISNPSISVTGTAYAIRNGSTGAITSWEAGAIKGNHIRLKGVTTNLTANTQVPVYTAGNTLKIFVSADL